jgi:hypothetical protein
MGNRNAYRVAIVLFASGAIFTGCGESAEWPAVPNAWSFPGSAGGSRHNSFSYSACPLFGARSTYNIDVSQAAVDPDSDDYIASVVQAGDSAGFYASTGVEQINSADAQTPRLTVHQKVPYHQFPVPYPWEAGFYIEPLGDAHAMVVDEQCHLYESYQTSFVGGVLSAYSGAHWNLTKRFVPLAPGNPSAMASGLPLFAGIVKWEDFKSGSIDHALNWDGVAHTVAQYQFVQPASDTDWLSFNGNSSYQMPYGARLRLKASFDTGGWGPQAAMVAQAMKSYGIYLADTGSQNALYFANAADGTNPWNSSDLSSLKSITMNDFEVLKLPPIERVPGH